METSRRKLRAEPADQSCSLPIVICFVGLGPVPWTVNSEIYPLWARSACTAMATSTNWMFNLIVSLTFLTLIEKITSYGKCNMDICLSVR